MAEYHQFQGAMNIVNRLVIYPAPERNKGPILDAIKRILFSLDLYVGHHRLRALEVGSGTGQHVAHFAEALPFIEFQPTDLNNKLFENIACLRDQNKLTNILDPVIVDLTHSPNRWPVPHEYYDLMLCSNVLHISPFETSTGLFDGARHCLRPSSGVLLVYGPFAVNGKIEPKSNQDFNESLRARNSQWGLRDVRMLTRLAEKNGLHLKQIIDMPANNKILYFSFKPN